MIHVVVVDDHPLVRAGVRTVLEATRDISVVAEFEDGNDYLSAARDLPEHDVVLLDLTMRKSDGLEVLERIRTWRAPPNVLVFSMHAERSYATRVMRAGAQGYATKDVDDEVLVTAVRTVAWGGTFLSPDAHAMLLVDERDGGRDENPLDLLSDQERRVFVMLRQGLTTTEISRELGLASNTVTTYKGRLMKKLGARSLVDLFRFGEVDAGAHPRSG